MPSYLSRDKRKFQSKIANFAHPVLLTPLPAEGVPLVIGYRRKESKTGMMGADGQKSFKIGLVV